MKNIALLLAVVLGAVSAVHAQVKGVSAVLKLAQEQLLPSEDMDLAVRITNLSGQDLTFGTDNDWISFSIVDENGRPARMVGDVPETGEFVLHSAQTGIRRFNLTPYFNFSRPGQYHITATIKLAQWGRDVSCKPISILIANGVPMPNVPELEVGVPIATGSSNSVPEVRKFILQKAIYMKELRLYCRLTDESGARTLKVIPIAPLVSFSQPEVQIDRYSNLHVLHQTGAKSFNYCAISPEGALLARQTYEYTDSRPILKNEDGRIYVGGGQRIISNTDIPQPSPSAETTP